MYALVEYKGKQYKAEKGAILTVDKLNAEKGAKIDKLSGETFDLGNASESELEDLVVDELGEDLYDFAEDYSWLFY